MPARRVHAARRAPRARAAGWPIHPLGADFAKHRGLYDPGVFAMAGLAEPTMRRGDGVCISRNKYGWSYDQVRAAVARDEMRWDGMGWDGMG